MDSPLAVSTQLNALSHCLNTILDWVSQEPLAWFVNPKLPQAGNKCLNIQISQAKSTSGNEKELIFRSLVRLSGESLGTNGR